MMHMMIWLHQNGSMYVHNFWLNCTQIMATTTNKLVGLDRTIYRLLDKFRHCPQAEIFLIYLEMLDFIHTLS